jgi:hypothetical protein
MQITEDSWRSSLDFNLAHSEYRRDSSVSVVTELRAGQPRNNCFYEGESNENLKSAIKIRNTARLSCKLTAVILMV